MLKNGYELKFRHHAEEREESELVAKFSFSSLSLSRFYSSFVEERR